MHHNANPTAYRILLEQVHQGLDPVIVRAPGRINLIGEHTDYNGGLALPAAINRYIYVSVSRRDDDQLNLLAEDFGAHRVALSDLYPSPGNWYTYVEGVAAALIGRGYHIGGFNLHCGGNIPTGAGLSSSAALCCGTVMALDTLFDLHVSREEMALIAQEAEHTFAGVQCGLMDQYACLFGKRGYAVKMDFSTLQFEHVRLNLEELDLVLLDTGVKHSLASTEYNLRKAETRRALELLNVNQLRDADINMLYDAVLIPDPVAFKRARFFLEENKRVETTAVALERRMLTLVGELLYESHQGLATLYNVSCLELDLLIRLAKVEKGIAGARMMGGGFGGCTINLVDKKAKGCISRISKRYEEQTGITLKNYRLLTAAGARVLEAREIRTISLAEELTLI
ncbi:galactokinase [Mucilaginibacter pineti]|uniref:Galactokinase n=1 Tax=Mucilaginibacter pineti TaxID=1391627 RepID=A0A1G7GB23_9SPHI|nr:galactokinase [Mucilaginibacter pineti]SDE85320.1 galactokinase [Mucilaginibacter pineti]